MTKVIDMRDGDGWTTYQNRTVLYRYRPRECMYFRDDACGESPDFRQSAETDITADEAKAWLLAKGYEVDDQRTKRKQLEVGVTLLSDSRVREIVREEVKSALDKLDEHYDRRCDSLAVRMDNMDHAIAHVRELAYEVGRTVDALTKAPPPPNAEPDWRGLLAELVKAWDSTYPLEAKLPESVLPFVNSPALAAARKALEAGGEA